MGKAQDPVAAVVGQVLDVAAEGLIDPTDKIEYARLLKAQGNSLGVIAKTGIPKTSLHRYLARQDSAKEP